MEISHRLRKEDSDTKVKFCVKEVIFLNSNENNLVGTLIVRVKTGLGLYPVPEAVLTVFSEQREESDVVYRGYTDKAGVSEPIILPSGLGLSPPPNTSGRLQPDTYTLEIAKDGFFSILLYGIPVYPGVITEQNVYMTPKPTTNGRGDQGYNTTQHIGGLWEEDDDGSDSE